MRSRHFTSKLETSFNNPPVTRLLAAKYIPNYKIAEELEVNVNKVARCRNRFLERRIRGIEKDLPRGANHGGKNSVEQAKLS